MKHLFLTSLCLLLSSWMANATDYTTLLTVARGFTEVTSTDDMLFNSDYCYILAPAENHNLIVSVGAYQAKPSWAGEDTKALRYRSATMDPVLDLSNFFTIEQSGQYVGFRNVVYSSSLFQTHDNAGYMYVLTYTEPVMSDWCSLIPTFQDGYWLFESGKYPVSSGNWACGYLGPWNKVVADGEPIALNRRNTADDLAGHYRLFRIARAELFALHGNLLMNASASAPLDFTAKIVNPSFETGDETGWTLLGKDPNGNDEFKVREYGMTNKAGNYLLNAYQWWATSLGVSQTVTGLPAGEYLLSGIVCTWEGRTVSFSGNHTSVSTSGVNDGTGIPVSVTVSVGLDQTLTVSAESCAQWWVTGHEGEVQTFFKLDDVHLSYKGAFLDGLAMALPNDETTRLVAGQWYYYDIPYHGDYWLIGNLDGMKYTTDGLDRPDEVTVQDIQRKMTLVKGRIYFKTSCQSATLRIAADRALRQGTFTTVALNVDGLPNTIATFDLNPDGPGADGTKKISSYLASKDYDIIGCSEDFNYNGSLMESLNDRYSCGTIRNTLSVGDLDYWQLIQGNIHVDTDGLNLIWKHSKCSVSNENWTGWNDTESTDGNQYVEKGYRHYDVQLEGGPAIDVFILHMDAGDTNATWSRESQWRQLSDAVNSGDHSRAKLIIGDTNSRWTREDIISNFSNRLSSDFTLGDVWVELYRDGVYPTTAMDNLTDQSDPTNYTSYEIVDKIIYINPKAANTVCLTPQSFRIEQDYTYGKVDGTDDTTPLGDHRPVVVTFEYLVSGDVQPLRINLTDDSPNNRAAVSGYEGTSLDVTLNGRTFYKDNSWNSLCLPFDLTLSGTCFEDAIVKELDVDGTYDDDKHTGLDGDVLRLYFKDATSIKAGTPYLVKWPTGENLVNPSFTAVPVSSEAPVPVSFTGGSFVGYYDAFSITPSDDNIYYLSTSNTLVSTGKDRTLCACRAYFDIEGGAQAVKRFFLSLGDDVATPVQKLDGQPLIGDEGTWYDLGGRRVAPAGALTVKPGIYLQNGRKIVIR